MEQQEILMWLKGDILPVSQASINVLSPTCQFGANVFEGLRAYENDGQLYIFRLKDHINRLQDSIKLARFNYVKEDEFYTQSILDVIKANEFKEDVAIRQTVFLDGFGSWMSEDTAEMFIAPIPKGRTYPTDFKGLNCTFSSWQRISELSLPPKIKLGANYMNSRLGQMEAKRNGYDICIFLNSAGKVSEGPGACIFMVRNGVLITPPVTASILESITRETLITVARDFLGIEVLERDVDRTELYLADEVFFCGTAVELAKVKKIDGLEINNKAHSTVFSRLESSYFDIVRGRVEQYSHWLTPVYEK